MAQQSTTFPPGGQLLNWVPGFATGGLSIRGIRVDNQSGSWLSISISGLGVQFIPPYTLGWSQSPYSPLSSITILSQGPINSQSTTQGGTVGV
jgi:hypothetical protein